MYVRLSYCVKTAKHIHEILRAWYGDSRGISMDMGTDGYEDCD